MRRSLLFLATALCVAFAAVCDEEVIVERAEIAARLEENIALADAVRERLAPEAAERLLTSLRSEVVSLAEEALPAEIPTRFPEEARRLLCRPFVVSYAHRRYNTLLLKKRLFDTALGLAILRISEPVSPKKRLALEGNVSDLAEGATALARRYTQDLVSSAAVDAKLAEVKAILLSGIDDRTSYALKEPVPKERIDAALREVESPLAAGVAQAKERFAKVSEYIGAGDLAKLKERAAREFLDLLAQRAVEVVSDLTTDPRVKGVNPDDLVPGYTQADEELKRLEAQLFGKAKD
ncbi:MAG: hypothetical protein V2A58_12170 [Planctomycetota bacterium]